MSRSLPVSREALAEAGITEEDVTVAAVAYGPGLVGALLDGLSAAKALLGHMDFR